MTTPVLETSAAARRDALAERILKATIDAFELFHLYLGERLGLYRALTELGDANAAELAGAAGIAERYAREWLEQQAVAGVVEVAADEEDGARRRYRLPAGHAEVLLDGDSLSYTAPLALGVGGIARMLPEVAAAFRGGDGVPYEAYGPDLRDCISRMNRPMFLRQLAGEWLPALPELHARLQADPPARVADVGCGTGWSAIAVALAYPRVLVHGLDLDEDSIAEARRNAAQAGLADRVTFEVRDAAAWPSPGGVRATGPAGGYDLVCAFEAVHDMADPVAALRGMRAMRAEGGVVLVGDEKVAESFTAPGDELERLNYGWSALHCLPSGMVQQPSAATGTVMRPATLRRFARAAGFADVEVLPIEHDFWRFYGLVG
jgi:2-polyprenyl-3-methyl-5-hydroxy-6-metoxy-1,4-benzoquinol methylase